MVPGDGASKLGGHSPAATLAEGRRRAWDAPAGASGAA
jgi:hypothetical protein